MKAGGIRLLVVAEDRSRLSGALAVQLEGRANIYAVAGGAAGRQALQRESFDVIVVDLAIREPVRCVATLHGFAPETPIVVLAATGSTAARDLTLAMQAGATERIHPGELDTPLLSRLVLGARERSLVAARARDADYRFASFIDAIPLGVSIVDRKRDAYYANAEARRILAEDLTMSGIVDPDGPRDHTPFDVAFAGRAVNERDVEFRRGDRRLLLDVSAFPVMGPDGSIEYAAAVVQDITERKRLERAVRMMAKLDAMGAMAASVAHDFNNLLSVISTFAYLALEDLEPTGPAYEDVAEIVKATERSQHLVGRLLSFAREGGPSVAESDINGLIVSAKKMLSRLLGDAVELELELGDGLPRAAIAESPFEEILVNLVVNARDAMPDGGRLCIRTYRVPDRDHVVMVVADTGIGMDEQTRELLFEPLFTTKAPGKGTGLGLHSVRSLVTEVGGLIEVDSELGGGTCFTLSFPTVAGEARGSQSDREAIAEDGSGALQTRVLVVEDDESFRRMLLRQLGRLGYDTIEAANGRDALALAEDLPRIDLLLTDVDMPGMDGPSLAAQLRALRPALPVVFMTGFDPPDVAETVLLKPFPVEDLGAALEAGLVRARADAPA